MDRMRNPGAAEDALSRANGNTYLWMDREWTLGEASSTGLFSGKTVSVKDCFDLKGAPTSCGTSFYRDLHGIAARDSWIVEKLKSAGAVIVGKTHLQPLAYGITGENQEFGDCLQPGDAGALTGGSSSGAAASVMEGSAWAAIGTDTGGSIRVPAALCGLAGYRASLGRGDWRGGVHLAESFDTFGWLFRDLRDGPLLGSIFGPTDMAGLKWPSSFAVVDDAFLHDCEPEIVERLRRSQSALQSLGLGCRTVAVDWWSESREVFAGIQASEAATIHRGHYSQFEDAIRQRLEWGAILTIAEVDSLRRRHVAFRERMDDLLAAHELLLLPSVPVRRLEAGADHSQMRPRLLRYTTPVSLAGMPAVTIPDLGMQVVAAREDDARLLALAAEIQMEIGVQG